MLHMALFLIGLACGVVLARLYYAPLVRELKGFRERAENRVAAVRSEIADKVRGK